MRNTEYRHRGFESRDLAIIRMELHTMNSYKRKQTSKCVQRKIDLVSKTPVKPLLSLLSRPYSEDVIGLLKSLAKLFSQPVYLWSRYKISFFILAQCSLFTKKKSPNWAYVTVSSNGTISPCMGNTTTGLSIFLTVHWFVKDTHKNIIKALRRKDREDG